MLNFKKPNLGTSTRSRVALAVAATALLAVGGISEASAKSKQQRQQASTTSQETSGASNSSWRAANAAITPASGSGRSFSGMASYYGSESGNKTASGQRFNPSAMTCAHRSLPFGTKLRVTHRGQSVVVTVNDRGPFIRGRVLDLSSGAARAVGLTGAGVGRVTAEII